MPATKETALALADALPRTDSLRDDMVAVGMVATALVLEAPACQRADLVDAFCAILRASIARELN